MLCQAVVDNLAVACCQKSLGLQGVAAHQRQIVSAKLLGYLLNEALLRRRLLYSRGRAAAPAEELECDGSRAGKQVGKCYAKR